MTENLLDAAYRATQQKFEAEQLPVRKEFDALVNIILQSQSPKELGFGVDLSDTEIRIYREAYSITAKLKGPRSTFVYQRLTPRTGKLVSLPL
jgi:hypothetical protein